MYKGKTTPVPVPTTGHVHVNKNGYVYREDDGRWDREPEHMVNTRKSSGKLMDSGRTRMYPNRTYEELFGSAQGPERTSARLTYGPYVALRRAVRLHAGAGAGLPRRQGCRLRVHHARHMRGDER